MADSAAKRASSAPRSDDGAATDRRARRRTVLLLPIVLAAMMAMPPARAAAPVAVPGGFDAVGFFAGRTHGEGVLKALASRGRGVHVDGDGTIGRDGALTLVQRVAEDGRPVRTREWTLRRVGPDGYAAVLSDAAGPVRVTMAAGVLAIRFRTADGLRIAQWLSPEPGGRVVRNHLIVRKHGVRVAVLEETIRKYD